MLTAPLLSSDLLIIYLVSSDPLLFVHVAFLNFRPILHTVSRFETSFDVQQFRFLV